MNNIKTSNLTRWILICLVSLLNFAQASPPPKMPTFDEVKVRQMLNAVEEGHNFSLLRVGYFTGRLKPPFPVIEGYAALESTLTTQQLGDLKWFLLKSLQGFAAFHAPGTPLADGFDAYHFVFDSAHLATTAQTQAALRSAVRDLTGSGLAALKRKGYPDDPRMGTLLLKAWHVWHSLPPLPPGKIRSPDWGRAIEAAGAQGKFTSIIENKFKDTAQPPDFSMLKLAVVVLQYQDSAHALSLLQKAQAALEPGNYNQQKWLYETWRELIVGHSTNDRQNKITDKNQLEELAEMHRQQIVHTGTGYKELLKLYWQLEQNDKAAELIKTVESTNVRDSEKIDVAAALLQPPLSAPFRKDKETRAQLQQQGTALLQTYLASPAERGPGDEIRARHELGRYFIRQDKITEAQDALNIDGIKAPPSGTRAWMYYQQIERLKAQLAQKLEGIAGVK